MALIKALHERTEWMLIRLATMDDYRGLCAVLDEVDALHQRALPQVFRDPGGSARSREYIASIVADETACLWVAEEEGQIVGILHISIRQTRDDIPILVPRRYAVIENVAVVRKRRRQRIGRALIERAERWASEQGIDQIELHVWEFNEQARAFYEALGYQTASRRLWTSLGGEKDGYRDG